MTSCCNVREAVRCIAGGLLRNTFPFRRNMAISEWATTFYAHTSVLHVLLCATCFFLTDFFSKKPYLTFSPSQYQSDNSLQLGSKHKCQPFIISFG